MKIVDDINVKDFQRLHIILGWKYLDDEIVRLSLENSMFKVSAIEDDKCVAVARIVGDGIAHGLLTDVIVHPDYQHRGIGTAMLKHLFQRLQEFVNEKGDEFLLELLPTAGNESFYTSLGLKHNPNEMAGVYKWFKNQYLYKEGSKKYYFKLNAQPFESIKAGDKTIEMRLMDDKRKKLKIGDYILFVNRKDENKVLKAKVVGLHKFDGFDELYKNFDKKALGYKENEIAEPSDMSQYYSQEDIDKYGVVGIEIELEKIY